MSLGDDAILPCFELLTDTPTGEIKEFAYKMKKGENPLIYKTKLAFELTKWLNSEKEAQKAKTAFEETFQKGTLPKELKEVKIRKGDKLVDAISQIVGSKSQAKRLVVQRAIDINGKIAKDAFAPLSGGETIRIGKKDFVKIITN